MGIGVYVVRYRRKRLNLPGPDFRAWDVLAIFNILVNTCEFALILTLQLPIFLY